jgi:hypothetical protein
VRRIPRVSAPVKSRLAIFFLTICFAAALAGQSIRITATTSSAYPLPIIDGNSPGVWVDGALRVYTSTGDPLAMTGPDIFNLRQSANPVVTPRDHYPIWIESAWRDNDGTIYAWYHHEPSGVCRDNRLTAPKIGALVSTDAGETFTDLGIVLSTGDPLNCDAKNGFFAGGNGDFSVILDRENGYFYFLFGNYSGPREHQGVAVARMPFEDRANPVGNVTKYYVGAWTEPGIGGLSTPIFPVAVSWEDSETNALWGPAVHWNSYLQCYIMVLNRTCCEPEWPQEGIYLSLNPDVSNPGGWSPPIKIMDAKNIGFAPGFYPQIVGINPGESDSLVGKYARLYIKGISKWEIEFYTADEPGGLELVPGPPDPLPDPPDRDRTSAAGHGVTVLKKLPPFR